MQTRTIAARLARADLASTLFAAMVLVGCYNPHITSGKLRCTQDAEHKCPDGFMCVDGTCSSGPVASTGGHTGSGGQGGQGGGQGGSGGQIVGCATRPALCGTAPASGCDPVCQTGPCDCSKKCGVVTSGAGTPESACVATGTIKEGALCSLVSDDCAPGLVCQAERCNSSVGRCYRFCRDTADCGGDTPCTQGVLTASGSPAPFRHCNAPPTPCDPIGQTGCPDGLVCYLKGATSGTICSCPGKNIVEGPDECVGTEECAPGLRCQTINGDTTNHCLRLCRSSDQCPGKDGGNPGTCQVTSGYGVCVY